MIEEYVVVMDPETNNSMELPIEGGQLAINTLECYFPGACGLSYKNPATGHFRALLLDKTGKKLLPPADGWKDKMFTIVKRPAAQTSVPSVSKELKWQQKENWRSYVLSFLYTSPGDSGGACVSSDGYLIGMNVSKTCMPPTHHTTAIADAALFVPKNAMIGAEILDYERVKLEKPADRPVQSISNPKETILLL